MSMLAIIRSICNGLVKGPVTHRYPSVPARSTPVTRGRLEITIDDCIFCGLCSMHCPADAITVSKPDLTWSLDRFRCIICGCCVEYCPKDCLHLEPAYLPPESGPVLFTAKGTTREEK